MQIRTQFPVKQMSGHDGYDGGLVYMTLYGQQIARQFVIPANPETTEQAAIRTILTTVSQAFGDLTDAERQTWRVWSQDHPQMFLGTEFTLQEMAAFCKINCIRAIDGEAVNDTAPTADPDWSYSAITAVAFNSGTKLLSITATHNKAVIADQSVLIRITAALASAQRFARKSDYRLAKGVNALSIPDLVASESAVTVDTPVFEWTDGQYLQVQLLPLNIDYAPGSEFTWHGTVTVT